MSNGICLVAQNNKKTDYVRQAYALALSVLAVNPTMNISLITNNNVPTSYKSVFDKIIPIPWGDLAMYSRWKVENRWKIYHVTPYENNIVLDVDMLVLDDIGKIWQNFTQTPKLMFTNSVKTYRDETITSRYYRKTFDANNLPDIYAGFYLFSKCDETLEFFKLLDVIMQNWETFYKIYTPKMTQKWCSVDVSVAVALKILDMQASYSQNNLTFTHMKPYLQNVRDIKEKWTDMLSVDYGDGIYINGFKQTGVLHYVEDEFLTNNMVSWLEEKV